MLQKSALLMLLVIILYTLQTFCFKIFNSKYMKNISSYFIFNLVSSLIISLLFFVFAGKSQTYHSYTILIGITFGVFYLLTVFFYTKAMETGPLSLSTLIYMSSVLMPVLAGTIFWGEAISAVQIAGLVLMLIMFYIMVNPGQPEGGNINARWIIYCFLSFFCNGCLGVLLKFHQHLSPQKEIMEFMVIAFAASAIVSIPLYFIYKKVNKESISHLKNVKFALLAACTAIAAGGANGIYLSIAGLMPGIVLFPTVSGSIVILSTVLSSYIIISHLTS
jgi:drug/metabolite transporter (DMT)-like permease